MFLSAKRHGNERAADRCSLTESIAAFKNADGTAVIARNKKNPISHILHRLKFSVCNLVNDTKLKSALSGLMTTDISKFTCSIVRLAEIIAGEMLTTQRGVRFTFSVFSPLSSPCHVPHRGLFNRASQAKLMLMPYQGKYDLAVTL